MLKANYIKKEETNADVKHHLTNPEKPSILTRQKSLWWRSIYLPATYLVIPYCVKLEMQLWLVIGQEYLVGQLPN